MSVKKQLTRTVFYSFLFFLVCLLSLCALFLYVSVQYGCHDNCLNHISDLQTYCLEVKKVCSKCKDRLLYKIFQPETADRDKIVNL